MKNLDSNWFIHSATRFRIVNHGNMSLAIEFALARIGWPVSGYGGRGFINCILAACNGRRSGTAFISHEQLSELVASPQLAGKAKLEVVRRHINGYFRIAEKLNREPIRIERGTTLGSATHYDARPLLRLAATAMTRVDALRADNVRQNPHESKFNMSAAISAQIPQLLIYLPVFAELQPQPMKISLTHDHANDSQNLQTSRSPKPPTTCLLLAPQIGGGTRSFPGKLSGEGLSLWAAEKLKYLIELAREGHRILPLHYPISLGVCSCPLKDRCTRVGKHPIFDGGAHKASGDAKQITEWFTRNPLWNPGIACDKLLVVDVDFRHGGHHRLRSLAHWFEPLPDTRRVRTGNGRHFYFANQNYGHRKAIGFREGIDIVTGAGNHVVGPYARHENGLEYRIEANGTIQEMPDWLAGLLLSEKTDEWVEDGNVITHGRRNNWLFAQGFNLPFTDEREIHTTLVKLFDERCEKVARDPLNTREIARIAHSVARYKNGRRLSRVSAA